MTIHIETLNNLIKVLISIGLTGDEIVEVIEKMTETQK